jgi:SAM-dependent methyltransferase
VGEFSRTLIGRSGYERDGFAAVYDAHRPAPPGALLDILQLLAQVDRPRLVVDLGAGTGLSTRAWAGRADEVIGVEANAAMVERARAATTATDVRYLEAFADATGIDAGGADVVTCSQAFHWMEPGAVLAEAARLLRGGGVFAAYDYDVPPLVQPDVDEAFHAHVDARRAARSRLGVDAGAVTWPKDRHVERIRASGHFRIAREIVCHGREQANGARIVGLAESIGGPRALFGGAAPEVEESFARLRDTAERVLGDRNSPMVVGYRIRAAVK